MTAKFLSHTHGRRELPDPILCEADLPPESREETLHLAVASARRWAARTDLSPETRIRRMWLVLATALYEEA